MMLPIKRASTERVWKKIETLEVMIAEARKFGIGLVLSISAHKAANRGLLVEALGNTATKIIFRVSRSNHSFSSPMAVK
ncbi:MAG: hypothetical protein ACUVTD_09455 [Nitrososphaerales archaeon]